MQELGTLLQYLFPNADMQRDIIVQKDGDVAYIVYWGLDTPQPTQEELEIAYVKWRDKMNAKEGLKKALTLQERMENILVSGLELVKEMQEGQNNPTYQLALQTMWEADTIQEMPQSLTIIIKALQDIQEQCPNLASMIFPE